MSRCRLEIERPANNDLDFRDTFEVKCRIGDAIVGKVATWREKEAGRPVMAVTISAVEHRSRRLGIGTQMYERAAQVAYEEFGIPLASDNNHQRSEAAEAFWLKQKRKGRATCIGESGGQRCRRWVLSCPAPASLAGIRRRR